MHIKCLNNKAVEHSEKWKLKAKKLMKWKCYAECMCVTGNVYINFYLLCIK